MFIKLILLRIFKFRKIISKRDKCLHLVDKHHPIKVGRLVDEDAHCRQYEGQFESPMVKYLGDLIPKESHTAHFELIEPTRWRHPTLRPLCIQLAGTGDHVSVCLRFQLCHQTDHLFSSFNFQYFWRRRKFMAQPLIRDYGIASIILENPFCKICLLLLLLLQC